jgi:hypothetical protein
MRAFVALFNAPEKFFIVPAKFVIPYGRISLGPGKIF